MTVLDFGDAVPGDVRPDMMITDTGVVLPGVEDIGAGRGPAWLDQWLSVNIMDLLAWRRIIHAHPELSRHERKTTELVAGMLGSLGLSPVILPDGTGVTCDIGSGDRCVALRADIDALPVSERATVPFASTEHGVAHACGHDMHAAALLGAAHALVCAPELPGRVRLIFQPAEEVMPGGALDVIAAGGLAGVDHIFGLHCSPQLRVGTLGTRAGAVTSATDMVELAVTSPGGHTSRPHLTADLVHALGTVITGLPSLLSRRVDPRTGTVLVWGAVHAGEAANAVPQSGTLRGTLRTSDRAVWGDLEPLVRELVEALLAPTGVGHVLRHDRGVPPVMNDRHGTALLRDGIRSALGEGSLVTTDQSSGGEDFAWYLEHVPGSFARLGVSSGEGQPADIHQPGFGADERALPVAVRVLVHAALSALG